MKQITILMADLDQDYLNELEKKFVKELSNKADIRIINEETYFKKYFNTPRSADILIINENLYDETIERHHIKDIFILTEETKEGSDNLHHYYIDKYQSVNDIYQKIIAQASIDIKNDGDKEDHTKMITVFSPIGGIGKTTIAVGLCNALSECSKEVLYIGLDDLQAFHHLMKKQTHLPDGIENQVIKRSEFIYEAIKSLIEKNSFSVLPPFQSALSSLGITMDDMIFFIKTIQKSKDYDYLVLDCKYDFSRGIALLMSESSYVVIVTGQGSRSMDSMKCLLNNIDYSDQKKFMFICNCFDAKEKNDVKELPINIMEYIETIKDLDEIDSEHIPEIEGLKKLALQML